MNTSNVHGLSFSVIATVLLSGLSCASQKPLVHEQNVSSSPVEVLPLPTKKFVEISPNISVSEDLAAWCKLRFDDATSAPKFEFDRSLIGTDDNNVLSQIAQCITSGPLAGRSLDLVGRADPRGENDYNFALGQRRAKSVHDFLSKLGVDTDKLVESSRGDLDAIGTEEVSWKRDRRVDILLH